MRGHGDRVRWRRRALVATLLAVPMVIGGRSAPVSGAPITPFTVRYQRNDNGGIGVFGNSLLSCPAAAPNCLAARAGTAKLNNNAFTMSNVDVDADPATFNSSMADVVLPSGASVLFAGLYWGARLVTGTGGSPGLGTRTRMLLYTPGAGSYAPVTSSTEFGPTAADGAYQEFADVTALVQAAGAGTYTGANVVAATGQDRYAGWALVVAYRAAGLPLRNLTVFDGFTDVGQGNPQTITINGFIAPHFGPVDTQLAMVAYEGDYSTSGDAAALNSTQLSTALSPGTNFFNGTIDSGGSSVTTRSPPDVNNLGFDIKSLGASGVIPNAATSATISLVSSGDRYLPGVVTTAINLYAPDLSPSVKSVVDLDGNSPAVPGDTLEYTLSYTNSGQDPADAAVVDDPLPAGTTFVAGSLRIASGANAGPMTDAAGDDQGEYVGASRAVRFRLGTGATAAVGGTIGVGGSTTAVFRVVVDPAAAGSTLANQSSLSYVAETLNEPFSYLVPPVSTPVQAQADLSVTKVTTPAPVLAGANATSTITVVNNGPSAAAGATVTDQLPAGVTFVSASAPGTSCAIAGSTVTCPLGTLASGASVPVTVVVRVAPGSTASAVTDLASVDAVTVDPDPSNNTAGSTVPVVVAADLVVTKTAVGSSPPPGGVATFAVTVTNLGPSDADSAVVSDFLGAGLTVVSATLPGATCTNIASTARCTLARLPAGAAATLTLVADVAPDLAGGTSLSDVATVTSDTADPVSSNNQATAAVVTAPPQSTLTIAKVGVPATVVAGRQVTYTVQVANQGPSDASAVVMTDPLPAGFTASSVTTDRGTCTAGPPVDCSLGTLVPGAAAVVTIAVDVPPGAGVGPATNTATASAADAPAVSASATTQVSALADLAMTKTGTPNPIVAGPVTYAIDVTNHGPSAASGVVLQDALPGVLTFTSAASTQGRCLPPAGGTLTCDLGTIPDGATVTVTLVMDAAVAPPATVTNVASVTSTTPDPVSHNNTASYLSGSGLVDLSITKTAAPGPAVAGTNLTYTLDVANAGPGPATNVVVTDPLPAGVTFVSASAPCTATAGVVTCSYAAAPVGFTTSVTITVFVDPALASGTGLLNTASVTSTEPDATSADNAATAATDVITQVNLRVVKTVLSVVNGALVPGASGPAGALLMLFDIQVFNDGPSLARNVKIVDGATSDAGVAPVPPTVCQVLAGDIVCDLPDLTPPAPGQPAAPYDAQIVAVTTGNTPVGTYTNTATVSSSDLDPDLTDNASSAPYTVTAPLADLALAKTSPAALLVAGRPFTYQLTVTPALLSSDAAGVVVTDTFPAGLTPTAVSSTLGTCAISGQTVTCSLGNVTAPINFNPAANPVITITGKVAPTASGSLTNTAHVTSATAEATPADNVATLALPVQTQADVTVMKVADDDPLVAGGPASYTVTVTNAGPSAAANVVLTDLLPTAIAFDPSSSDAACGAAAGGVTCNLGTVPPGVTLAITVAGRVAASYAGATLTDTASVVSTTTDPNPGDDQASVTSNVVQRADLAVTKRPEADRPTVPGTVAYDVSVSNRGPSDAVAVDLTDGLPPGTTLVSATPTPAVQCATTATSVTCPAGTLAVGQHLDLVVVVDLPGTLAPGALANTATASASTPDPDPTNSTATALVDLQVVADVAISNTVVTNPIVAGQPVSYRIDVVNRGPAVAPNASITNGLPAGTTLSSVQPSQGACNVDLDEGRPIVGCDLGPLAVGASASATVTLVPDSSLAGQSLSNTAAAGSGGLDPVTADNRATATGTVTSGGSLPTTGAEILDSVGLGLGLVGVGSVLTMAGRRRRGWGGRR